MLTQVKLGKRTARADKRIPMLEVLTKLPSPPTDVNWYAAVGSWGMLGNDTVGDCVEAAVLHLIQQMSTYAGSPLSPTTNEAMKFYEDAAGYNPADPTTDQGSYVMGHGGVMEFWYKNGVVCGGKLNKVSGFLQLRKGDITGFRQGVWIFGGCLTGILLPEAIVSGNTVPYIWSDYAGPVAGGHEILIDGYETLNSGVFYDLISWGQRFRCTQDFLLHCMDEAVVAVDPAEINARGVNAAGLSLAQLTTDMRALGGHGQA